MLRIKEKWVKPAKFQNWAMSRGNDKLGSEGQTKQKINPKDYEVRERGAETMEGDLGLDGNIRGKNPNWGGKTRGRHTYEQTEKNREVPTGPEKRGKGGEQGWRAQ